LLIGLAEILLAKPDLHRHRALLRGLPLPATERDLALFAAIIPRIDSPRWD
jgi:hypothetical protein